MTRETIRIKFNEGLNNKKAKKLTKILLEQIKKHFKKEREIEIKFEYHKVEDSAVIFTVNYNFDDFEKTNKPTFVAYLRNFKRNSTGKLKEILENNIKEIGLAKSIE